MTDKILFGGHYMSQGLNQILRFRRNSFIAIQDRDSTQEHTDDIIDIFNDITADISPSKELDECRQSFINHARPHDYGEVVTEFFTARDEGDLSFDAERSIAAFFYELDVRATALNNPDVFWKPLYQLRILTGNPTNQRRCKDPDTVCPKPANEAMAIIQDYMARFTMPEIVDEAAVKPTLDAMLHYYDAVECDNHRQNSFMGSLVKSLEKTQGSVRAVEKSHNEKDVIDKVYPFYCQSSQTLCNIMKRNETSLESLRDTANTKMEYQIFEETTRYIYNHMIDYVSQSRPIIDMRGGGDYEADCTNGLDSHNDVYHCQLMSLRENYKDQVANNIGERISNLVTKHQLLAHYHAARDTMLTPPYGKTSLQMDCYPNNYHEAHSRYARQPLYQGPK